MRSIHQPTTEGDGRLSPARGSLSTFIRACGAMVFGLGAMAIAGWSVGPLELASISDRFIPMSPKTAVAAMFLGGALVAKTRRSTGPLARRALALDLFAVVGLCVATLLQASLGWQLGVDALLLRATAAMHRGSLGAISPVSAAGLLLLGTALAVPSDAARWKRQLAALLAAVAGLAGALFVSGYAFGTPLLYGGPTIPLALTTALALLLLGAGVLAQQGPAMFPLRLFVGDSVRARLLRAFVPLTVLAVLGQGWLANLAALRSLANPALSSAGLALLVALAVGWAVAGVAHGVSAAIDQAEAGRRRSDEASRLLVEGVKDYAIFFLDAEERVSTWSAGAARIQGYSSHEAIGRHFSSFFGEPDVAAGIPGKALEDAAAAGRFEQEAWLVRADGTRFCASVVVAALHEETGKLRGFTVVTRDVTRQKELAAKVMQMDRILSVGTLAAGLGHEINNPLAYVIANLRFLQEEMEPLLASHEELVGELARLGPEAQAARARLSDIWARLRESADPLRDAAHGAERIKRIVGDLRAHERGRESKVEEVDVRRVLDSALSMVGAEIERRATLVRDEQDVPAVVGSPARLGQVFTNLLVNAAQAIPEGAAATNEIRVRTGLVAGRVAVEVRDTGCGIAPEHLSRMFVPFFTTRPVGQGTGLGLYVCQGIIRSLGGDIEVETEVGKGSTFRVLLPIASEQASVADSLLAAGCSG